MSNTDFLVEVDQFIDENWEEIVDEIAKLVSVPSIADFDRATPEDPSGPEAHDGLRAAVDLAARLGFDAKDDAGQIGKADLEGESETMLGMICHSDVVAPGIGWTLDPWTLLRKDGFLLGRGVLDDKGPLVASLYCMKFFKDKGEKLPYTLRMLIGTNEETGTMRDVAYYLENYPAPAFTFTPDDMFPVCYGEKGGFDGLICSKQFTGGNIIDFTTGEASTNAVPSQATLVVRADAEALPAADNIDIYAEGDYAMLVATGRGGHASMPAGTVNAIDLLVQYALDNALCTEEENVFLRMIGRIMASTDGSSVGIDTCDGFFDPLTCIAGTIHFEEGRLKLTIDIRFPTSTSKEDLLAKLAPVVEEGEATIENTLLMEPFLMKPDSPAIVALVESYREATGLDGEPFTIGGGTYAREFPCAASFGPEDPHDEYPEWVGPMHGADEGISEESLKRAMRVYILTIKRLMEMDLLALSE